MASESVKSEITGKVWKVLCPVGTQVGEEEPILIIESMKMEIPVIAPAAGTVARLLVGEGDDVAEGQEVAVLDT
ncbi:MAG: acetyl-CoA carboxylase biotin carboxyl carrier protein subunit [Lautropia sp.]